MTEQHLDAWMEMLVLIHKPIEKKKHTNILVFVLSPKSSMGSGIPTLWCTHIHTTFLGANMYGTAIVR